MYLISLHHVARFLSNSELEPTKNVVKLNVAMQPIELHFLDSVLRSLRQMQSKLQEASQSDRKEAPTTPRLGFLDRSAI